MKISITVIIILTTLLCVLPFVWFMLIGKTNAKKKEKIFKMLTKERGLSISQHEQWNNNFIGIDVTINALIYIKLTDLGPQSLKMDLNTIKSCQINKVTRDYKRDKKVESELQSLQLELTLPSNSKEILYFYDINEQFSEDFEMKRAEKWQFTINQMIMKKSSNNLAA